MKALATALVLAVSLVLVGSADAGPPGRHSGWPFSTNGNGVTIPPEWAGIWQITDTTYTCAGAFQSTSSFLDTLCAGTTFDYDTTGTFQFTCTGTATSTTYDQTCDGSDEIFPDCVMTFHLKAHGTRTADSYFSVFTMESSASGTGEFCDQVPSNCTQYNTHGTRIGPAPAAYCATPVKNETWGKIKAQYR
jgi:hypothetical protein